MRVYLVTIQHHNLTTELVAIGADSAFKARDKAQARFPFARVVHVA